MKNLLINSLILSGNLYAQPLKLDTQVFADRRVTFMEKIEPNSIAIFPCKPAYLRNFDIECTLE